MKRNYSKRTYTLEQNFPPSEFPAVAVLHSSCSAINENSKDSTAIHPK